MSAYKVFDCKGGFGGTDEEGASLAESGEMFPGDAAVGQKSAAVGIAAEGQAQQSVVQLGGEHFRAECGGGLSEEADPGIIIRCTFLRIRRTHQFSVGRGYQINFLMNALRPLLHYQHGEDRGAGRNTAGPHTHAVLVAAMPVAASSSGGARGMPGRRAPPGSRRAAPSSLSLPAISPT